MLKRHEIEPFLVNFWQSRDKSPETPENEFMLDCFARIKYANEYFKGNSSGVNSDMGRIFIVYGQPDEIEDFSMNMDGKPYIIWHYFTTGTGKQSFVFIDYNVIGIYTLVHSTVEGEIHNAFWRERELN
jgi:GWxTD domain-containing protein